MGEVELAYKAVLCDFAHIRASLVAEEVTIDDEWMQMFAVSIAPE